MSRCKSEGAVPLRRKTMNKKGKWQLLPHLLARPDRHIGHVQRYKGKWVENRFNICKWQYCLIKQAVRIERWEPTEMWIWNYWREAGQGKDRHVAARLDFSHIEGIPSFLPWFIVPCSSFFLSTQKEKTKMTKSRLKESEFQNNQQRTRRSFHKENFPKKRCSQSSN